MAQVVELVRPVAYADHDAVSEITAWDAGDSSRRSTPSSWTRTSIGCGRIASGVSRSFAPSHRRSVQRVADGKRRTGDVDEDLDGVDRVAATSETLAVPCAWSNVAAASMTGTSPGARWRLRPADGDV